MIAEKFVIISEALSRVKNNLKDVPAEWLRYFFHGFSSQLHDFRPVPTDKVVTGVLPTRTLRIGSISRSMGVGRGGTEVGGC